MPQIVRDPHQLFALCESYRAAGQRVGLVPTMGALHAGHLSLVDALREQGADRSVVSIFVNPLQFGPNEDFSRYPRTLEADLDACRACCVDVVYAPDPDTLYPPGFQTHVEVAELTQRWEGAFRPGHFRGVTTVVAKLLIAVGPCLAAFGRKDYQQWRVIQAMVQDLGLPVRVVDCPIVREPDGLALSSRNRYLDPDMRQRALAIYRGLSSAAAAFASGEREAERLLARVRAPIAESFDHIDYVACTHPETLEPIAGTVEGRAVLLVAAHLHKPGAPDQRVRLIDNWLLKP